MADLATVVTTTAGTVHHETEGRAVGLDVTKTFAVVALLVLGPAGLRALGYLVFC